MKKITDQELSLVKGRVIPTLATVLAVGAIAIITIAVYKLYKANKGKLTLGSNYGIEWSCLNKVNNEF